MPEVTPETAKWMLDFTVPDQLPGDEPYTTEEINETFDFFNEYEEDLFAVLQTTLCPN